MSIAAIATVFEAAPTDWPSGMRLVALALADRVNDTGLAWPKLGTLAAMTGLSARNVSRHLAALEDAGWITRETRTGDTGRQTSNLYRFVGPIRASIPTGVTPTSPLTPTSGTTPTTGRDDAHVMGPMTPTSGTGMTPTSSLEPSEEPPAESDTEPSLTQARHLHDAGPAIATRDLTSCPKHPKGHGTCAACHRRVKARASPTAPPATARTA